MRIPKRLGPTIYPHEFRKTRKRWPQYELDGLIEREMIGRDKVILPVWHGIGHADVFKSSPPLANRYAVSSADGMPTVVRAILDVIRPKGSPLINARKSLLDHGVMPPVITDSYWLRVIEASNRSPAYGPVVPEDSIWGRWSFPLPEKDDQDAEQWGECLAMTAMQLEWVARAEKERITPISEPEHVLAFIQSQPGLLKTCQLFPELLIEYAPQLSVSGFGGPFELMFEQLYVESKNEHLKRGERKLSSGGLLCDKRWALRHPSFGNYKSADVACEYFSGGIFGPPVSPYEHIEHLVWLLSKKSDWLPKYVREFLIDGMIEWPVWPWMPSGIEEDGWESQGALMKAMVEGQGKLFRWTMRTKEDALHRFERAINTLALPESAEEILEQFRRRHIAQRYVAAKRPINRRR